MIGSEVLFNSKCNLYNYMYNIIPNLFGRENIIFSFRDTDSIVYKIKNCPYENYFKILKENPHLFFKKLGLMENEIDENIFIFKNIIITNFFKTKFNFYKWISINGSVHKHIINISFIIFNTSFFQYYFSNRFINFFFI